MKKFFYLFSFLGVCLAMLYPQLTAAELLVSDDGNYEYQLTENGVIITAYLGTDLEVDLSAPIDGHKVIGIGSQAFKSKSLTQVIFPETLQEIADSAFEDNKLTILTLENMNSVGKHAFKDNLIDTANFKDVLEIGTEVVFGNPLRHLAIDGTTNTIHKQAFSDSKDIYFNLATLDIGGEIKTIDQKAFNGIRVENEVVITATIHEIGYAGFNYMHTPKLTIEGDIQTLGQYSFNDVRAKELIINGDIGTIGQYGFNNAAFESIVINGNITEVQEGGFYYTGSLTTLIVNGDIDILGQYTFYNSGADLRNDKNNYSHISYIFNGEINTVGGYAFANNYVGHIEFTHPIETVSDFAFNGVNGLKTLNIPSVGHVGEYAFSNLNSLENFTLNVEKSLKMYGISWLSIHRLNLGSGIDTIPAYAVYDTNLACITLSPTITTIANNAFNPNLNPKSDFKIFGIPNTAAEGLDMFTFIEDTAANNWCNPYGELTVNYQDAEGNTLSESETTNYALGMYTFTPKELTGWVAQTESQTVTFDADNRVSGITFIYDVPEVKGSIILNHVTTEGDVLETTTENDLTLGTYTKTAQSFEGYTVQGDTSQEVVLTEIYPNQTITFTYVKDAPIVIEPPVTPEVKGSLKLVHQAADGAVLATTTESDLSLGSYTKTAQSFEGYTLQGVNAQTVVLTEMDPNQTITFTFVQDAPIVIDPPVIKGSLTVVHQATDGAVLGTTTETDLTLGAYTKTAQSFTWYTLQGEQAQTVVLTEIEPTQTITFTFVKDEPIVIDPPITPEVKGSITVIHQAADGAVLSTTTESDLALGSYTKTAQSFDGYTIQGETSKTVVLTEVNPNQTITFVFTEDVLDIGDPPLAHEVKGSITVIHQAKDGEVLDTTTESDLTLGSYTKTAQSFEGYTIQGETAQTVVLTETDPNQTITFMFVKDAPIIEEPTVKPEVTGSITVYHMYQGTLLKTVVHAPLALTTHEINAVGINGYVALTPTSQWVTLTEQEPHQTITFMYDKEQPFIPGPSEPIKPKPVKPTPTPTPIPQIPTVEEETRLCTQDFVDTLLVKATDKGIVFSQNKDFSIDRSVLGNGEFKLEIISQNGEYTITVMKFVKGNWTTIHDFKHYLALTIYSECFEDKVFLRVVKGEQSAIPHSFAENAITLYLLKSERLTFFVRENPFKDSKGNKVVEELRNRQIIYGKTYTSFAPNDPLTRGHMAAIVSRSLGLYQAEEHRLVDTKNHWASDYAARLQYKGLLLGNNAQMNLNDHATAGQLYKVLNRVAGFVDGSKITYEDYFGKTPKHTHISREQAVSAIHQVLQQLKLN